jgi:hypothetical protein
MKDARTTGARVPAFALPTGKLKRSPSSYPIPSCSRWGASIARPANRPPGRLRSGADGRVLLALRCRICV